MRYKIDDKWYEAPPGYVMESMFFNPRHPEAKYLIKAGDKILAKRYGLLPAWYVITADDTAVGVDFKELVERDKTVLLLAIPQKYEFDETGIHSLNGYFDWSCLGMGFGQMSFSLNAETGKVEFDTEMMGPETTRKIMHDFVDFLIDNGVSSDWDRKEVKEENVD